MTYTTDDIEDFLYNTGELMVILDSDREYDLHIHDTEFDHDAGHITTEGMMNGEYVVAQFLASTVEHVRWHKQS
jgi:hypothetical protein